jgi:hypothetical protein
VSQNNLQHFFAAPAVIEIGGFSKQQYGNKVG